MRGFFSLLSFSLIYWLISFDGFAQTQKLFFNKGIITRDSLRADAYGYFGKLSQEGLWVLKTIDIYDQVLMTGSFKDEQRKIPHGEFTYYQYTDEYNLNSSINFDYIKYPVFMSRRGKFEDGKLQGAWVEYYPDGGIKSITNYLNGIKHGLYVSYDWNNRLLLTGNYVNGLLEGEWVNSRNKKTYFQNGRQIPQPQHLKIHEQAFVVDTHGDILYNQIKSGIDIGKLQTTGHFDLPRALKGGLDAQIFSVWSDASGGYAVANQQIDSLYSFINRYPNRVQLVKNAKELVKAVAMKKFAALIGVEGGHMIENDLQKIQNLSDRGMVYLTLTWNNSTSWASSAAEENSGKISPDKAGLNDFGIEVVKKLNDLGVMIDLSHVGEKTFYEVLKHTKKPVILSHSSAYALNPVPRNLKDEQILAIGKNNGLISLNLYNGFLDPNYRSKLQGFFDKHQTELTALTNKYGRSQAIDTLIALYPQEAEAIRAPIDLAIDHIDHFVKLIGVNHVGLGADFDGAESFPQGLNSVADYPLVTKGLIKRGYSKKDIEKILGLNFYRVFKANRP